MAEYSGKDKKELLTRLDDMFTYAADHPSWVAGRLQMAKCFRYKEGEQWTAKELAELERRGQPDTVNNQIAVVVHKLVGDLTDQRYRIGYRGRNAQPGVNDEQVANALTDIFLYIRQSNDLEFEEIDMAEDGFISGFGVMEVYVTFDDLFQPEIKVRHEDCMIVFPDPDSRRYDWNEDAKFIARAKWFDVDEAVELYPKAKKLIDAAISSTPLETGDSQLAGIDKLLGKNYVDQKKRQIRIIEVQYKKHEREEMVLFSDGRTMPAEEAKAVLAEAEAAGITYRTLTRVNSKICVGVYGAGELLEHKETDFKYFSLVPYWVFRRKSGEPYSLVTLALSMQDAVNKRESKALHLLNTNQAIYERSTIPDPSKFAEEKAKPDGMLEVADGALRDKKIEVVRNLELAQSQFTMHMRAQDDLYRIVGVDPQSGQQTGELRSGSGLKQKYAEASKPVATLFNNLRRSRKILGRVIADRVSKYYTPGKVFLITDDQKKSRSVTLDAPIFERLKTFQYDVVVDEFVDTTTLQQEQWGLLLQYLPQILPHGPFWTKKLLQMSDLRDKDQHVAELEAMSGPPPIEPRVSLQANMDKLTPEERAFFYDRMGAPELAQQVRQMQPMTTDELKGSVQLATTAIKENKPEPKKAAVGGSK